MIAVFVRIENDTTIIHRKNFLQARLHVDIPKLQVTAVFLFPVVVQINNNIQPALNIKLFVQPEVRVHTQETTRFRFMQSATAEIRIGYQTFDAGEFFKKLQHGCRVEGAENISQKGIALSGVDLPFVLPLIATLVEHFIVSGFEWKMRANACNQVFRQKIIDYDVRKWRGLSVATGERVTKRAGGAQVKIELRGEGDGQCLGGWMSLPLQ